MSTALVKPEASATISPVPVERPVSVVYSDSFETTPLSWTPNSGSALARVGPTSGAWVKDGSYSLLSYRSSAAGLATATKSITTVVGGVYTVSVWARAWTGATVTGASVGVVGIGNSTPVTLGTSGLAQLTYTFTATASTHSLILSATTAGTGTAQSAVWDYVTVTRQPWIDPSGTAPLPVSGGRVTIDESWAPYVQATVDVPLTDLELLERIDPRQSQRVTLTASESIGGTSRTFNLGLRGRTVDHKTGKVTLNLASDEALLFDKRRLAATVDSTPRTFESSLRSVCSWALGKIGATLSAGTSDADVTAAWDATNLQTNPTAQLDTSGWVGSGGTVSKVNTGATTIPGTGLNNMVRVTMNAGATGGPYFAGGDDSTVAGGALTVAIREQQLYRVSAWVRTSVSKSIRLSVQQRSATNTQPGTNLNGPAFTTTANTWHRLSFVFQAYPGAIRVGLYAYLASGTYAAGETIDITGVTITEGTLDVPAFSGGTSDSRYTYAWNGTQYLSASTRRAIVPRPPELFDWKPGQSLNDFLRPLVEASGLLLFCDEARVWRLIDPNDYEVPGYVVVQAKHNATEGTDSIDRNTDEWGTGVLVVYRWTDADGIRREAFDFAGTDDKVITIERESEYPGPGAAAYFLNSRTGRGRVQEVTALVHFGATPTQDVTINLPGTLTQTGKVRRVTFGLSDGLMDVGTRGLTDALPGSWAEWNPSQVWAAVNPTLKWKDA
ncbi:carbohydrate binding domain-containing protein [Microbacterium hydrocarbonoxydans]|uniref:carbohydrate binding domain-containing protein n=1 Tax=Microbacterium hydrocarbonoxydans TaxID=273678 RepID=UPI003D95FD82